MRARLEVDVPLGEAVEHLVERDAALESGERRAEAVVNAVAEPEVLADLAMNVEPAGILPPTLVAVRGRDDEQHGRTRRHRLAVHLDILGDVAPDLRTGRLEAQELLDRVVDQRPVFDDLTPLVGVLGEHLAEPADQSRGGLVPRARDHRRVQQRLVARQSARHAVLVLELRVQQLGHQIVGRVVDSPVDVLLEASRRRTWAAR